MRSKKNLLDEMQEQKMLHIEQRAYQIAFSGLVAAILIQSVLGSHPRDMAGESVVLLVMAGYVLFACLKNGIWERKLKADNRTNAAVSLAAGLITGLIWGIKSFIEYRTLFGAALTFVSSLLSTMVLCYLTLWVCCKIYRARVKRLEQKAEESEKE